MIVSFKVALIRTSYQVLIDVDRAHGIVCHRYVYGYNVFAIIVNTFHIVLHEDITTYLITIDSVPKWFQDFVGIVNSSHFKTSLLNCTVSALLDTKYNSPANSVGKGRIGFPYRLWKLVCSFLIFYVYALTIEHHIFYIVWCHIVFILSYGLTLFPFSITFSTTFSTA